MKVQILGTGCPKCKQLEENAKEALPEAEIEKVEDMNKILEAGVMMTPALAIDGKVVSSGKVLSPSEIKELAE